MSSLEPDTNSSSWRSRSHSEELLQTFGSASSVDSFIIEGKLGNMTLLTNNIELPHIKKIKGIGVHVMMRNMAQNLEMSIVQLIKTLFQILKNVGNF